MWKTDRLMRPIHMVSYDEQPGCKIRICAMGPTENNAESGVVSTLVYYGVNQESSTIIKWANDQGYVGIVQVRHPHHTCTICGRRAPRLCYIALLCLLVLILPSLPQSCPP